MQEINVGIIGYGFMGKTHTYGYKTIPLYYEDLPFRINLRGVCTRRLGVAKQAQETQGFAYASTNALDILNDPTINVVNICTPNIDHKDMIVTALKRGKHVYCEKPLAASYGEAREILEVLDKHPAVTQITHQNRFLPATIRAKEIIDAGKIGRILSFRASYLHSGSVDPNRPIGWKQDARICGGGVLFDLGSHVLDLIYHLLGPYQSIFATTDVIYPSRQDKQGKTVTTLGDDLAILLVQMANGGTGVIEASKIATGTDDELRLEIHGDQGALRFNLMEPNYLEYYDQGVSDQPHGGYHGFTKILCTQRYAHPGGVFPSPKAGIGWLRGHVHSLYLFLKCVYEQKPASPSIADGAYIQYIMEQAYTSAQEKRWINLNTWERKPSK